MKKDDRYETVIVGGGQSGLSVGYHLQQQGRSFVILDANERIGDSWRKRWDSLRLYSPAFRDGLPGMPFPAPRTAYPTKDEMGDYLEAYATRFELPLRSGAPVHALTRESGRYVANARDERFEADNVVVATGVFEKPYIPEFAGELDPRITQLHANDYRNLSQLRDGPVLVVGASHSGSDIAHEAAGAHHVILSGKDNGQLPVPLETRRGRIGFRILYRVGTNVLTVDTPLGRKMRPHIRHGGGPLLRYRKKDLEAVGVERVLARTVGVERGLPVSTTGAWSTCAMSCGAPAFGRTSAGSAYRSTWARTVTRCSTEVPPHRRPACTLQGSRSCIPLRRCSSPEARETQSGLRVTS